MAKSYKTKNVALAAVALLDCGDCFSAVYEAGAWYVFSNVQKKFV